MVFLENFFSLPAAVYLHNISFSLIFISNYFFNLAKTTEDSRFEIHDAISSIMCNVHEAWCSIMCIVLPVLDQILGVGGQFSIGERV